MMNRRIFLKYSALTAMAALTAPQVIANQGRAAADSKVSVVVDRRIIDSIAYAQRVTGRDNQTFFIETDMVDLWYSYLQDECQQGLTPIAGLTREADFFVLKQMARDYLYDALTETTFVRAMSVEETLLNQRVIGKSSPDIINLVSWVLAPLN